MTDRPAGKPMLLALGGDNILETELAGLCHVTYMTCDSFFRLSPAEFEKKDLKLVTSDLFSPQTDCIEIGQHLNAFGFQGTYLIRTETLPNPKVIKRELRQLYPDLDCLIVTPDELIHFLSSQKPRPDQ